MADSASFHHTPGTRDGMEGPRAGVEPRISGAGSNIFLGGGLLPEKCHRRGRRRREVQSE